MLEDCQYQRRPYGDDFMNMVFAHEQRLTRPACCRTKELLAFVGDVKNADTRVNSGTSVFFAMSPDFHWYRVRDEFAFGGDAVSDDTILSWSTPRSCMGKGV